MDYQNGIRAKLLTAMFVWPWKNSFATCLLFVLSASDRKDKNSNTFSQLKLFVCPATKYLQTVRLSSNKVLTNCTELFVNSLLRRNFVSSQRKLFEHVSKSSNNARVFAECLQNQLGSLVWPLQEVLHRRKWFMLSWLNRGSCVPKCFENYKELVRKKMSWAQPQFWVTNAPTVFKRGNLSLPPLGNYRKIFVI